MMPNAAGIRKAPIRRDQGLFLSYSKHNYESAVFFTNNMSPITMDEAPTSIWTIGVPPVTPVIPALSGGTV